MGFKLLGLGTDTIPDTSPGLVFNKAGRIIFVTGEFLRVHNICDKNQIFGQTVIRFIRCLNRYLMPAAIDNSLGQIRLIWRAVLKTLNSGVQQNILIIRPYFDLSNDYLITVIPGYDEDLLLSGCMLSACQLNEFEAYRDLSYESRLFRFYGSSFIRKNIPYNTSRLPVNAHLNPELTLRQKQILFLLHNGMSQYKIAELLQIKRGTVAKCINTALYSKLKVNDTLELLRKTALINHLYPLFFKEVYNSLIN